MDPRLRIHNAVIGLAHPSPPWPSPLHAAGYRLARIEQPVGTALGEIVVDLILAAPAHNAALCIECKDGTVQEDQARRYGVVQPLDLVQTTAVGLPDPPSATLDIAYAVAPEHVDSSLRSLERLAPRIGVLEIGPKVRWHGTPPTAATLQRALAGPMQADLRSIPRLLLVDDSSPVEVLAAPLVNVLHGFIVQGRDSVTIASLIEMACWGWPNFARAFQGRLVRDVQRLLRDAAGAELKGLISVEKATGQSMPAVRIAAADPLATQAGELRAARAVRAKLDAFVSRLTGQPTQRYEGQMQFVLLDADATGDDERDDDS